MTSHLLIFLALVPAQTDASLENRFKSEAPQAWRDYVERIQAFQGQIDVSYDFGWQRRVTIKQGPGCLSILLGEIVSEKAADKRESCQVINPEYSFTAKRVLPNREWAITNVRKDNHHPLALRRSKLELYDDLLLSPVSFSTMHPNSNLSQESGFVVKSATPETKDGVACVRIQFEFRPKANDSGSPIRAQGCVLYNPDRFWLIREYDVDLFVLDKKRSLEIHMRRWGSFHYEESGDRFPVVKRAVSNQQNVTEKRNPVRWTWEYQLEESESPATDFLTPAFGLPDAGMLRKKPTPWYLWLGLAGIICIVLGIGFQKLRNWAAKFQNPRRTKQNPSVA